MAGNTDKNLDVLSDNIEELVKKAKENGIDLGAVHNLVGRQWRAKAA